MRFLARNSDRSTTMLFQVALIIVSSFILYKLVSKALYTFTSFDEYPEFYSITPEIIKEFGHAPGIVNVGLSVRNFPVFEPNKNQFQFDGILSFEFDPSIISLDTLSKFSFEKGKIESKSEPKIKSLSEGRLLAQYDIRVQFTTTLREDHFPFNDRSIFIVLINKYISPGEVIFNSSLAQFNVTEELQTPGWIFYDHSVRTGYIISKLDASDDSKDIYYPVTIFQLDFRRSGLRQALLIILPIMIIFYTLMFSLALDPVELKTMIISLSVGAVTAILAYRFVIENLSPQVGYFMVADSIYFTFLFGVVVLFIVNLSTDKISGRIKELLTLGIHACIVLAITYFLRHWLYL
jgi:hypothetical protein